MLKNKRQPRFNYMIDLDFGIGIGFMQPHKLTGWKLCVSLDVTFLSVWMYLFKIK